MIKKVFKGLLTLFVVGLGIINFSSAVGYTRQIGVWGYSPYSSYDLNVTSRGGFMTQNLGVTKRMLMLNNANYLFWDQDGLPYMVANSVLQGKLKYYDTCPELQGNEEFNYWGGGSCSRSLIGSTSATTFANFLSTVTSDDYYFFSNGKFYCTSSSSSWDFFYCISNHSLGKSLCFGSGLSPSCDYSNAFVSGSSKNLSSDGFDSVSDVYLFDPPGSNMQNGGSTSGALITSSCNLGKALNWYENNGYTSRLCYAGLTGDTIWDGNPVGTLPVYGQGMDVETIWLNFSAYRQGGTTGEEMYYPEFFGYRRQLYSTYKRGGYSTNPFIGTPLVLFTYFGAVDVYGAGKDSAEIREYCALKLYTSDYTPPYHGVNKTKVCSALNFVDDSINGGGSGGSGGSDNGEIIGGFNTNNIFGGSGSGSGSSSDYRDGRTFMTDFFNLLQENFGSIENNGLGFLPGYLIVAFMGVILFKFLRK